LLPVLGVGDGDVLQRVVGVLGRVVLVQGAPGDLELDGAGREAQGGGGRSGLAGSDAERAGVDEALEDGVEELLVEGDVVVLVDQDPGELAGLVDREVALVRLGVARLEAPRAARPLVQEEGGLVVGEVAGGLSARAGATTSVTEFQVSKLSAPLAFGAGEVR
jgi:hypothetical protein